MTESPAAKTASKAATSATEKAAVNRAAKAAAEASKTLPTVVETAELAMEVPSKVVLNQKLIVVASVLGGAALGAGALFAVNKFRSRSKAVVISKHATDDETQHGTTA